MKEFSIRFDDTAAFIRIMRDCMTDEQRLEIISSFCSGCGDVDPSCQCWNDE